MSACILFADDDPEIRVMMKMVLERAGFRTLMAENGRLALQLFRTHEVDLVLLDLMMPVMDGIEACQRIRELSDVPVIFLTVMAEEDHLLRGFSVGAQDYIAKPFRPRELIARIHSALSRRVSPVSGAPVSGATASGSPASHSPASGATTPLEVDRNTRKLIYQDLLLDLKTHEVIKGSVPLGVTVTGYQILEYFMLHIGQVVTKEDLLREVWHCPQQPGCDNMVEAAIKRLRKELGDDSREPRYLKTIWGRGYRFGEIVEG